MSFENKVILITGGSAGIGACAAEYFAKEGALLSLVGRNAERMEQVVEKIKENGVEVEPLTIIADITCDAQRIISETIDKYQRLDILINNAGVSNFGNIETLKLDDFDIMIATNVRATIELTQLAVPYLIETEGNIVNISSVIGMMSCTNYMGYSMSKAALDQFTRCCAMHLADKKIRVNSVNPGFIDNDFHVNSGVDRNDYGPLVSKACEIIPVRRLGQMDECVDAIAFLASNNASYITGVNLRVDGGFSTKSAY